MRRPPNSRLNGSAFRTWTEGMYSCAGCVDSVGQTWFVKPSGGATPTASGCTATVAVSRSTANPEWPVVDAGCRTAEASASAISVERIAKRRRESLASCAGVLVSTGPFGSVEIEVQMLGSGAPSFARSRSSGSARADGAAATARTAARAYATRRIEPPGEATHGGYCPDFPGVNFGRRTRTRALAAHRGASGYTGARDSRFVV